MSHDIGIVLKGTYKFASSDNLSQEEILSLRSSERLWDSDEEAALAGTGLLSAEASGGDWSNAILSLATSSPDRFRHLVDLLPPLIQDIFYQYYWLGRTYSQIGATLFPRKTANAAKILVKLGNRLGERALAALVAAGGDPLALTGAHAQAWEDACEWRSADRRPRMVRLRGHRDLGAFTIIPNGQLRELFAPTWSVLGPSATGGSRC